MACTGPGRWATYNAEPTAAACGTRDCKRSKVLHSMTFHSIYAHGFARVAACVTTSHVADPSANTRAVLAAANACHDQSVAVAVFPELCLSGYAIEDLVKQDPLLDAVERGLASIVEASLALRTVLIVGAPLRFGHRIYNCAIVI